MPGSQPASIFNVADFDPARNVPGAPPFFGQDTLPHTYTSLGRYGLVSQAYLNADEATAHSRVNANRMRVDCGIMEPLEARQRSTALLNWHIEPEDPENTDQKLLAKELTKIVARTRRFTEMRRCLLEAIWFGRYAVNVRYGTAFIGGKKRTYAANCSPRHGDKLVFRYDDGNHKYEDGQVGIRVGLRKNRNWRLDTDREKQIEPTEHGLVYWLNKAERRTLIVHKHHMEDAPFEEPRFAGQIHGAGVRSKVYWTWYMMTECLQRVLEYLDRAAFGFEIWKFPAGNKRAEERVKTAATQHVGGGRTIILCPVPTGEQADQYGVEHIEPGFGGVDSVINVIKEFFGHKIKRYICGQTLTSESDSTGLGSGVADAHLATFADIVSYDARNLEETLTEDFLRPIQAWNFPKTLPYYMRFVIDTESDNAKEKLEGMKSAWDMGMKIKASDVADCIGISIPSEEDDQLFNPQIVGGIKQAKTGGLADTIGDRIKEQYYKNVGLTVN
jgi:phage gp29-like protein